MHIIHIYVCLATYPSLTTSHHLTTTAVSLQQPNGSAHFCPSSPAVHSKCGDHSDPAGSLIISHLCCKHSKAPCSHLEIKTKALSLHGRHHVSVCPAPVLVLSFSNLTSHSPFAHCSAFQALWRVTRHPNPSKPHAGLLHPAPLPQHMSPRGFPLWFTICTDFKSLLKCHFSSMEASPPPRAVSSPPASGANSPSSPSPVRVPTVLAPLHRLSVFFLIPLPNSQGTWWAHPLPLPLCLESGLAQRPRNP